MVAEQKKLLPVVILTHEFFPKKAGVSVFVQEVAREASRDGRVVTVLASGQFFRDDNDLPYSVTPLTPMLWRVSTLWHLVRARRKIREAVLYLPEQRALRVMVYLGLLKLFKPASLVITLYGSEIYYFDALPNRRWLFARLLQSADRITVLSRYCRELLAERFPGVETKTQVLPGAVRSDFFPAPRCRESRQQGLVVLTVARIHPRKGQMAVLKALNALENCLKRTTLYRIVGPTVDGKYRRALENYAAAHGLNVEFVGEVSDQALPTVYQQADIFVMTSKEHEIDIGFFNFRYFRKSVEGFGLSYLEASASGLPVLAFKTGGVEDAVKDGETGILVQAEDTDGLARSLKKLLEDSSLRERMGEAGRRWAKTFSWDTTARGLFGDLV